MTTFPATWSRITSRLDAGLPDWRSRIDGYGQVAAVEARERGDEWSDDQVFQGVLLSVLSNNTVWERASSA